MIISSINKKQMIPIMLTAFITPFMGSALNLAIPAMSEYFSAGAVSIGWVVTAYFLSSTSLLIPLGKFVDLHSKKLVFVTGIIVFGLFSILCSCAWSLGAVIAFRLGQGVGASMLFATNSAIIASNFPASMRGRMMGLSVMFTYIGLSAGPVLGGFLNQYLGWRSIFVFTFLYCVPSLITSVLLLDSGERRPEEDEFHNKESCTERSQSDGVYKNRHAVDVPGGILFTASAGTFLFGLSNFTTMLTAKVVFVLSFIMIALFIRTERRAEDPVLDLKMFTGSRAFTLSNIAALLNYGASSSISYLISLYLQNVRGMSSDRAGLILIATPVLQAILSPMAGRLSDRYSPYKLASVGMLLTCVGIVMLIFIDVDTAMWYLIFSLAIVGTGFAFFSSPNSNAIMSSADRTQYGVASSIMSASRTIGQTASMAVVTMVIGAVIGNVTLDSAEQGVIVSALQTALVINAVLCGIGIYCSARR